MADKVAAARQALDSLVYAQQGGAPSTAAAATTATGVSPVRGRYAPDDRAALLERLQTYRPGTWFGKPACLSPAACALLGWRNIGPDRLSCEFCGSKVAVALPLGAAAGGSDNNAAARRFAALLTDNHADLCPWRARPSPRALLAFPPAPASAHAAGFEARAAALRRLDRIPDLSTAAARRAAAAAAEASAGDSSSSINEGADATAALAALMGLTPEQLEQLRSSGGGGNSDGSSAAATGGPGALPFDGAARLLALLGWELRDLRASSSGGSSKGGGAGGVEGGATAGAGGSGAVASAHAALHCAMCAGGCSLAAGGGSGAPGGPGSAKRSRVAELATASREQLLALEKDPSRKQQQHRAGSAGGSLSGGGGGGGDLLSPSASSGGFGGAGAGAGGGGALLRRQESTPDEVAASLGRTIAGGDRLTSPPSSGRFGSPPAVPVFGGTSEPAFGLPALEAEARKRRRSGSAGGGGGSVAPENGPKLPVSLRDPTAAAGASARPPPLDPFALHRPWCPWVAAPAAAAKNAPAAAGIEAAPGWLAVLHALQEVEACGGLAATNAGSSALASGSFKSSGGASFKQGGGGSGGGGGGGEGAEDDLLGPFDARGVEEEVRRSRAAMAAKVRAALDALEGP